MKETTQWISLAVKVVTQGRYYCGDCSFKQILIRGGYLCGLAHQELRQAKNGRYLRSPFCRQAPVIDESRLEEIKVRPSRRK